MEQQLADTRKSTEEAIARASEAEERAKNLEQTVAFFQEQLQIDQVHRKLWPPNQLETPVAQVVQTSSPDTLMDEPAAQVAGNSTHDTPMVEEPASDEINSNNRSNDDDTDMNEVNKNNLTFIYKLITAHLL
jgi:hypothetical protein